VAERLVPVRRTEARVDAGTSEAGPELAAAGANGRSLLVRVPFAERRVLVAPAAGASVPVPVDVDFDEGTAVGAVLAEALLEEAFFVPAPAVLPLAGRPLVGPDFAGLPVAEPDCVDPVPAVAGLADADVRFRADDVDLAVGFSALMEQRYAVFSWRRESDSGRARQMPARPSGSGADGAARRGPRGVHFPALWASWAGPSRSSWSSR